MNKKFYSHYIFLSILFILSSILPVMIFGEDIVLSKIIVIPLPPDAKVETGSVYINIPSNQKGDNRTDTGPYVAQLYYRIYFNNESYSVSLYFLSKEGVSKDQVIAFLNPKVSKILIDNSKNIVKIGQGSIYQIMSKSNADIIHLDETMYKIISAWGSHISYDILAYYIPMKNHEIFSDCLFQVINIWPKRLGEIEWSSKNNQVVIDNDPEAKLIYDMFDTSVSGVTFP